MFAQGGKLKKFFGKFDVEIGLNFSFVKGAGHVFVFRYKVELDFVVVEENSYG